MKMNAMGYKKEPAMNFKTFEFSSIYIHYMTQLKAISLTLNKN